MELSSTLTTYFSLILHRTSWTSQSQSFPSPCPGTAFQVLENQPPARKRKRSDTEEGESSLKQRGKEKQPLQDATTPCSQVEVKKLKHVDSTSTHTSEGKGSVLEGIMSLFQGPTIVSDYNAEHHGSWPPKHKRAEANALPSARGIPMPPSTQVAKKAQHRSALRSSSSLIPVAHCLPTPGTSVPHHTGHVRPAGKLPVMFNPKIKHRT